MIPEQSFGLFFFNKNFLDTYDEILDQICKYTQAKEEEAILRQTKKDKNEKK